jgi:hypothetical protein
LRFRVEVVRSGAETLGALAGVRLALLYVAHRFAPRLAPAA